MDNSSYSNHQQQQFQHQVQEVSYAGHDNNVGSVSGSTSTSAANGSYNYSQVFSAFPPSNNLYGYGPSNYQSSNYGYLQQGNDSYAQNTGIYPGSAAPYQSVSSFQNRSSYTELASYPGASTYYNGGAYQASTYPPASVYSGPTGAWNNQSYNSYGSYPSYGGYSAPNSSSNLNAVSAQSQYQQECQQWADYYASLEPKVQSATVTSSAPGTEPDIPSAVSLCTSTPTYASVVAQGTSNNFYSAVNQPPPPGTQPSWQVPAPSHFETASQVTGTINNGSQWDTALMQLPVNDSYGQSSEHFQQVQNNNSLQQEQQDPLPSSQQDTHVTHIPEPSPSDHQKPLKFHSSVQQFTSLEASKQRMSKLQIPTNPRITQNLGVVISNGPKGALPDSSKPQKPAYISIRGKSSINKVSSDDIADATLQPGMFPPSLRAYVERALALCKDDAQKAVCQDYLKEIITQASCDGSLFSKDWDIEPLYALSSMLAKGISKQVAASVKLDSVSTRRVKSRWEPVGEKLEDIKDSIDADSSKTEVLEGSKGQEFAVSPKKWEKQETTWINQQQHHITSTKPSKRGGQKIKKPDPGTGGVGTSSESDTDLDQGGFHLGSLLTTETPEEKRKRQTRTKRFERSKEYSGPKGSTKPKLQGNASSRRASAIRLVMSVGDVNGQAVEDINWDSLTIRGTCQEIEKRYLRLTSAPDPSTVRPEDVLRKALAMVQSTPKNYLYKCEQLKSIRQDLTVQRIRNEFTVQVYETHARMALEAGDLAEYNQCQAQLKGLYSEGISGSYNEFTAYSLLYMVFQNVNNRDLLSSMARLSHAARQDEAVRHALAVRSAVATGNYTSFFRLYRTAPKMSSFLMDLHVERMRFEAVKCMSRSYRPTLPLSFMARTLGFSSLSLVNGLDEKESDGLEDCEEWLKTHGAQVVYESSTNELMLETKMSAATLFMPEPEDVVPHGDANLAVNDFLTRS
ncbi:hypothetical protein O6H91_02G086800 [Diphasiastrum complanatum]|uniref:Uncharacterized protein n=1 Tax=Diphasiastrum complanatum TaxID=34168 RepID=A0ACC2EHV4_DIPCM|nr:hypothetical protein O6H91_02G086800 [Diphasiastrum complanatum]